METEKILKIAVCDDEKSALEIICGAIGTAFSGHGVKTIIDKFSSVEAMDKRMDSASYDLLLLDIKIGSSDGISFAVNLRKRNIATEIIFISSCEDRVFEAFSVRPFGFIRKSQFLKDITEIVAAFIRSNCNTRESNIVVQTGERTMALPIFEITYIECFRKSQTVYITGGGDKMSALSIHSTMAFLEEELASHGFLRVHKGYIVNYRFIRLIDSADITLIDGSKVPVSRKNVRSVREQYLQLMQSSGSPVI